MRRLLVTLILGAFLACAAGCADLGITNPFESSPTAVQSRLLGITLPAGMEISTKHCARTTGSDGQPQGMETAYGKLDQLQVAQSVCGSLQGAGWNLRLSLRRADRIMLAFENGNRMAVVFISSQTVYSCVMESWVSEKLPDGSTPNLLPLRGESGPNGGFGSLGGFGGDSGAADGASGGGFGSDAPATGGGFETPDSGSTPPPVGGGSWGAPSTDGGLQERPL